MLDPYEKLSEFTRTIEANYPREYTWLLPVRVAVQPLPSIQDQYLDACIGNTPKPYESSFITKSQFRFKLRSRYLGKDELTTADCWTIQIWALCNEYTLAKVDKMLGTNTYYISGITKSSTQRARFFNAVDDLVRRCGIH